jgi:hypothetical protein
MSWRTAQAVIRVAIGSSGSLEGVEGLESCF